MTTALIIIATIIFLMLIIALIIGTAVNVEETIIINKPLEQAFDYVKFVKNHDNFSVWAMMDPDVKKEYKGTDGNVRFVYAWDSNKVKNVGAGEQEIKHIDNNKSIEHEIRFSRPYQDIAKAKFYFESISVNQTKIKWGFYSKMKFPMNIMKPMIQNMLNMSLEKGLHNLKNVREQA